MPDLSEMRQLSFREELHALEAAIAGQGIAITSDVLVGDAFQTGALIRAASLSISGYGYYVAYLRDQAHQPMIDTFSTWARSLQ